MVHTCICIHIPYSVYFSNPFELEFQSTPYNQLYPKEKKVKYKSAERERARQRERERERERERFSGLRVTRQHYIITVYIELYNKYSR